MKLFQEIMFQKIVGRTPPVYVFESSGYATLDYKGHNIGYIFQKEHGFEITYEINIFNQGYTTSSLNIARFLRVTDVEVNNMMKNFLWDFFKNRFGIKLWIYDQPRL